MTLKETVNDRQDADAMVSCNHLFPYKPVVVTGRTGSVVTIEESQNESASKEKQATRSLETLKEEGERVLEDCRPLLECGG